MTKCMTNDAMIAVIREGFLHGGITKRLWFSLKLQTESESNCHSCMQKTKISPNFGHFFQHNYYLLWEVSPFRKQKGNNWIYLFPFAKQQQELFQATDISHHLMWLFLIIVLHNNVFIWLEEETDVDEWPWETHTVDLPVKSIKHFYCDKYWQSHSHWMKVTKHLTLNTNKVWWICRALHVVCLNKNKTKDIFSSNQN